MRAILACSALSLVVGCASSSTASRLSSENRFKAEPIWAKPAAAKCPEGTFESADACAVCSPRQPRECEAACSAGNGESCALLASFIEAGFYGQPDHPRAASLFERACQLDSGEGCEGLARALMSGRGRPTDEKAGADLFRRMCAAGRGRACTAAGVAALGGRGGPKDEAKGLTLLKEGCAKGDVEGCILESDGLTIRDVDAAVDAARSKMAACAKGQQESCAYGQRPLTDLRSLNTDAGVN